MINENMMNFQKKIDEMQRKLNVINNDIDQISNNTKILYKKRKLTNNININHPTKGKIKINKPIETKNNIVNSSNNSVNFFRVNNTNKNQGNNLKMNTRPKTGYKKGIYNLTNNENNPSEKQLKSSFINKTYYMNQKPKEFPVNILTKDEDILKETKKIFEYNKLKQTYNDYFQYKNLSYNYNYPTRNFNSHVSLNINALTAKNKNLRFLNNYLSSDSNNPLYSQREKKNNINNIDDCFNDIHPSPSSYNLDMQGFKNEFENRKNSNGNDTKKHMKNYHSFNTYGCFLNNEENKKLIKKALSDVNMKIPKLNETNNSQIISDIIEITNEYINKENKINTHNILDEYKKLLRDIKVKNEFIFKMIKFYNRETKSNLNFNDPESLLIIWNWVNKRKLEEEIIKKEDEKYKKICLDIMQEYKIKNISQLKLYIHKLFKRVDKNENFLEGIKKILLP